MVAALGIGRVSRHEAAAAMCHAAAVARCEWVRQDAALGMWCLPWKLVSLPLGVVRGLCGLLPGVESLVRIRLLLFGIAAVQAWQAGPVVSVLLVGVGVMSYLQPTLERSASAWVRQVGDRAVAEAGLGEAYLRLLEGMGQVVSVERRASLIGSSDAPARCAARG